jgi:uncharacterized protein (DUF1330 family)
MNNYGVAHMQIVEMGAAIVGYRQRIDDTPAPTGGRFLVRWSTRPARRFSWAGSEPATRPPTY